METRQYDKAIDLVEYPSLQWNDAIHNRIALLNFVGVVTEGGSVRGQSVGVDSFLESLDDALNDNSVRAIVIRFDSGGGGAAASRSIAEAIYNARGDKPIISWVGSAAASGAYYAAAATDHIIASPGSITGSIGVLWARLDASGLLSKIGVNYDGVQSGENAHASNIFTPPTEKDEQTYRDAVEHHYQSFIEDVAKYRAMDVEVIDSHARGRVWSGADAQRIGLVDSLGHYKELITYLEDTLENNREMKFVVYDHSEDSFIDNATSVLLTHFGLDALISRFTKEGGALLEALRNPDNKLLYYDPLSEYGIE